MSTSRRELVGRIVVVIGTLVLLSGASLHFFAGYPAISKVLLQSNLKTLYSSIFQLLWALVSVHWVITSGIALVALFSRSPSRGLFLGLAALLPLIDAVALFIKVGVFVGNIMLASAGCLLIIGAAVLPRSPTIEQ